MKQAILIKGFLIVLLSLPGMAVCFAQGSEFEFDSIPEHGTILIYGHLDDDLIWMLPWWEITDRFIGGAIPATPTYEKIVHEQQLVIDSLGYDIDYESGWITPWGRITDLEHDRYYWNNDPAYAYLAIDHLEARLFSNLDGLPSSEINKMKAKLEPFVADSEVSRIVTHNNWGEYGHRHHMGVNKSIRELAVKYRKDVWMLGCDNDEFVDVDIPVGITYTMGSFNDSSLYAACRGVYQDNWHWTWYDDYVPSGEHAFLKIVDQGNDKSGILTGDTITYPGAPPFKKGAYIFDGTDDYLTLTGKGDPEFTIAMWVRPGVIKPMDISMMSEYPGSEELDRNFYLDSAGRVTARIFDGGLKSVISDTMLTAGEWTHIAMTGDGSSLKLFINGTLEDSVETGTAATDYETPEFIIGQSTVTPSFFNGQVSDVNIVDRVLSESELTDLAGKVHIIRASAGPGGTILPTGSYAVEENSSQQFIIQPIDGYVIGDVLVDGVSVGPVDHYLFDSITTGGTIAVSFQLIESFNFALNKPTSSEREQYGRESNFANDSDRSNESYWAALPNPSWWRVDLEKVYDINAIEIRNYVDGDRFYNYIIESSLDDENYTKIVEKTDTIRATEEGDRHEVNSTARYIRVTITYNSANVGGHISDFGVYGAIHAFSDSTYHTITSAAGLGGSILPDGTLTVKEGTNQTYVIKPSHGFEIGDVLVDTVSVGAVDSFTFNTILSDHTLQASFLPLDSFNIALNKPTFSESSQFGHDSFYGNDEDGSNESFWGAFPYPQWWMVDLEEAFEISTIVVRNYVDGFRYYNYTIESSLDNKDFALIAEKDDVSPATHEGDVHEVDITARYLRVNMSYNSENEGVHITDFRVYGDFHPDTATAFYTVTSSAGEGGNITPLGVITVEKDSHQTFRIDPDEGYEIEEVLVDSFPIGAVEKYTFTRISTNHTISATFIRQPFFNLALNKPATSGDSQYGREALFGNDSDGSNNSFWAAEAYPQWWKVDLEEVYNIASVVIRNWVDSVRYYNYTIEASTDDVTYEIVGAKSDTIPATHEGDLYRPGIPARYLKVTMTYNSANEGVHITDFRVYDTLDVTGLSGTVIYSGSDPVAPEVSIFPNPFGESFTLEIRKPSVERYELSLFDLDGRKVREIPEIGTNAPIRIGHSLKPGIYILQLNGPVQVTRRIIKF